MEVYGKTITGLGTVLKCYFVHCVEVQSNLVNSKSLVLEVLVRIIGGKHIHIPPNGYYQFFSIEN